MEEKLPEWDLSSFYQGYNDEKITQDKESISQKTKKFVESYKDKLLNSSYQDLLQAIKQYENIDIALNKIMSFSYLTYVTNLHDKEISSFLQSQKEFAQSIASQLTFFDLELNKLPENHIQGFTQSSKEAKHYESFLKQNARFKPFQLPEIAEQIFIAKSSVSSSAWVRLYDETLSKLNFKDPQNSDNTVGLSEVLNLLLSADANLREKAAQSLEQGLLTQEDLLVTVINNIIKDKAISQQFRGFKQPYSSMNLSNLISDKVMLDLVESVRESYEDISQKYYKIKAKVLGVDKLNYWDRNAPMFKVDTKISYSKARNIVQEAYNNFDKEVGEIINLFFTNSWIDAKPSRNKDSGAFCHPTTVENNPYILMNFHGEYTDVTTLAHELGHGVHQYLARGVGELQAGTPLVLAETASIFGEQLVFDYLLKTVEDSEMKKFLLSNKIEGIINSVHRQIAFHSFEEKLHDIRKNKELSKEEIKSIFIETQKDCLGDSINLKQNHGIFWGYVSHFFHVPFYVYAYAFGDCLVRSLYALYKSNYPDFKQKYISLLQKGGTITPEDAIATFGLDLNKSFWKNGLNSTKTLIQELETLI